MFFWVLTKAEKFIPNLIDLQRKYPKQEKKERKQKKTKTRIIGEYNES